MAKKRHGRVGLGGTFDHFHDGHKHFIRFAAALGDQLLIGITTEKLYRHKPFAETIEEYRHREKSVQRFCDEEGITAELIPLDNPLGPTLEGAAVHALCVSPETVAGADKINIIRQQFRYRPLPIYICDYLLDKQGQPIHSEAVRAGKISRQGDVYMTVLAQDLTLNKVQRDFFTKPQGPLIQKPVSWSSFTALVGDTSLETFITNGWRYNLGIFDQMTQRESYTSDQLEKIKPEIKVKNVAGTIALQLTKVLQKAIAGNMRHVLVEGEEDLAAVALVLLLPLGSVIYYGQKDQGIVAMKATEELKLKVYHQLCSP